jgi:DNA-binding beta-propeller fold protein YncE
LYTVLIRDPLEPGLAMPVSFARSHRPLAGSLALLLTLGCGGGSTRPDSGSDPSTHPSGSIASTLSVIGRPHGVAIARNGRFCVTQIDAASVTCGMLTAGSATLQASVTVGDTPAHVALSADGSRAYTANQYGSSASVLDANAPSLLATVSLPSQGFNVLADPGSSRVYVTTSSGMLQVIDAGTRTIIAQVQVGLASNGLALDRAAGILYVSSISAGTVAAVSTATNAVTKTYTVSAMPQRIALSADGKTLYVATESTGLEILDLATGTRSSVSGVDPQAVGLALAPDGKVVYVTNPARGKVQIVNLATRDVTTLSGLASPRNVAFGLSGAAALVTGEGNTLYVIR